MIELSSAGLARLTEAYGLANTPEFLYRRLRRDEVTLNLAHDYSVCEIVESLKQRLSVMSKDVITVVTIYALLVSLTYKDFSEVDAELKKVDLSSLDWGHSIWSRHSREQIATHIIILPGYTPRPISIEPSKAGNSSLIIAR